MADFNRIFNPTEHTYPEFPTGFESWSISGKAQFDTALQVGRQWTEKYGIIPAKDANARSFFSYLNELYHSRTIFDIVHLDMQTPANAPITGAISVNGANQTGTTINVTSTLNKILKAGDIIKFAGLNLVYNIKTDMTSPTAGSISIYPPIFAGGSPSNGATITITGVKFRAALTGSLKMPARSGGTTYYAGLTLTFRECP
ncbi:MAG: hypothetical protein E3K29_06865 [Candidatus Brocadia sp.]|nr:hypothetical protein [Candidatus Brocadia sp.]